MARRFHFRLEAVLKVRRVREREAQRRVAARQAEIARLDQLNAATGADIEERQRELLRAQAGGCVQPAELARGRAWIAHLRNTIAQRQTVRAELTRSLRLLQEELREARKQTRIIEKLRERRWGEYRAARAREEQSAAEELAQQLHACGAGLQELGRRP